jgi:hypothetical protein
MWLNFSGSFSKIALTHMEKTECDCGRKRVLIVLCFSCN